MTRPCTKRKDEAPAILVTSARSKPGPPAYLQRWPVGGVDRLMVWSYANPETLSATFERVIWLQTNKLNCCARCAIFFA